MIEPQPVDEFSLAADAILAKPAVRKAKAVAVDFDPVYMREDDLTFRIEIESFVGRMVRQIRDREETQARALLRLAFDAGSDAVSRCCGCSPASDEDFDAFVDRLLNAAQEA